MKKKFNFKKFYINIFILVLLIYAVYVFASQQSKLNSYSESQKYYSQKIVEAEEYQEELNELKENVNSEEYIEEIAREKLDMYLPNERVFIDIGQ